MPPPSSSAVNDRAGQRRAAIIEAALALLQQSGLDGVSTRRLAEAMGVSGPSLYWHFESMGALRGAMADRLIAAAQPGTPPSESWPEWLAAGARAIRRAALSHRDGARLLASAPPSGGRTGRRTWPVSKTPGSRPRRLATRSWRSVAMPSARPWPSRPANPWTTPTGRSSSDCAPCFKA